MNRNPHRRNTPIVSRRARLAITRLIVATALGILIGGGLSWASWLSTGMAHADVDDDIQFVELLNSHGFHIYDTAQAIHTGHMLCGMMRTRTGRETAREFYVNTSTADVPTLAMAETWVRDAATALCPAAWDTTS